MIAVECLLDECAEASYNLAEALAGQLIVEIVRQWRFDEALHQLIVSVIDRKVELLQSRGRLAQLDEPEVPSTA
jgi:hypothetical protein